MMDKDQAVSTIKQYAMKGLEECKDHCDVAVIGTGLGIIIAGVTGWNFAACLCVGVVVMTAGCFVVFDKTNPQ